MESVDSGSDMGWFGFIIAAFIFLGMFAAMGEAAHIEVLKMRQKNQNKENEDENG